MNAIDNLTFGELKQIAAMFAGQQIAAKPANPVIGEYCIARCYSAGVHAGVVESVDGENVVLRDSRACGHGKQMTALRYLAWHNTASRPTNAKWT